MQPFYFAIFEICAGRVVRVGDENHPRFARDQRQKCVDIGAVILVGRNDNIGGAFARGDIVNRKAVADVNDIIACPGIAHRYQVEQFVGTGATDNLVGIQFVMRAERCTQRGAGRVGITRQSQPRLCHRGCRVRAAPQRIFVGG